MDFDTAIAMRGQLEQNKLEKEEMDKADKPESNNKMKDLNNKYPKMPKQQSLKEKFSKGNYKSPDDMADEAAKTKRQKTLSQ